MAPAEWTGVIKLGDKCFSPLSHLIDPCSLCFCEETGLKEVMWHTKNHTMTYQSVANSSPSLPAPSLHSSVLNLTPNSLSKLSAWSWADSLTSLECIISEMERILSRDACFTSSMLSAAQKGLAYMCHLLRAIICCHLCTTFQAAVYLPFMLHLTCCSLFIKSIQTVSKSYIALMGNVRGKITLSSMNAVVF